MPITTRAIYASVTLAVIDCAVPQWQERAGRITAAHVQGSGYGESGRERPVRGGAAHCASTKLRFCGCCCHARRVLVASALHRRFQAWTYAAAAASDSSITSPSGSWAAASWSSQSRARSATVSSNEPGVKDRDCSHGYEASAAHGTQMHPWA